MSNTQKNIPTLNFGMSSSTDEWIEGYVFEDRDEVLKKIKEVIKYTLKQAAEKVSHKHKVYDNTFVIDKDSILSLEDEIIKKLGI